MGCKLNLIGRKYGRLTVIEEAERSIKNKTRWICRCECGNISNVGTSELRQGNTKSCGCIAMEWSRSANLTHGHSSKGTSSEYNSWTSMKSRCLNPNHPEFKYWGGRGVKIHTPWIKSFELFFEYMGPKPSKKHSLDRFPNKDGDYEPGNLRWADPVQQQNNRRNNRRIEYDGRNLTLTQWASFFGVTPSVITGHLKKKTIADIFDYYERKKANLL